MLACEFFSFVHGAEGDRATLPSFATVQVLIEASSALLEVLIATWNMQWGCKGGTLPMVNKDLFANLLLFASGEGGEGMSSSFKTSYTPIQASSTLLEALIAIYYM